MKTADQIDATKLKAAIKLLNDSGLLTSRMKVIGKTEELLNNFVAAVDNLSEEAAKKIPVDAILFYNDLFPETPEAPAAPTTAAPAAETPAAAAAAAAAPAETAAAAPATEGAAATPAAEKKPKKEKKAKEPKDPNAPPKKSNLPVKPKTDLGHVIGSQAGILDECLKKGATMDEMKAEAKCEAPRITSHIKHLRNDKKLNVTEENGVWKIR